MTSTVRQQCPSYWHTAPRDSGAGATLLMRHPMLNVASVLYVGSESGSLVFPQSLGATLGSLISSSIVWIHQSSFN